MPRADRQWRVGHAIPVDRVQILADRRLKDCRLKLLRRRIGLGEIPWPIRYGDRHLSGRADLVAPQPHKRGCLRLELDRQSDRFFVRPHGLRQLDCPRCPVMRQDVIPDVRPKQGTLRQRTSRGRA